MKKVCPGCRKPILSGDSIWTHPKTQIDYHIDCGVKEAKK